jgi:hypothetical protein
MPLVKKQEVENFRWGLWKIEEEIDFFEKQLLYRTTATHTEKIKQQLASRLVLEKLENNFPFQQVEINEGGKPFLLDESLHFSISHCAGYAAAILSNKMKVGMDIEVIHERVLKVEKKFLSGDELDQLNSLHKDLRVSLVTLLWSLKESFYKWWGKGGLDFSTDMSIVNFRPTQSGTVDMQFSKIPGEKFEMQFEQHDNLWITWICK